MAEHSTIEWTDATWNPITGCSVVSPGCTNCYAMRLAGGRLKHHRSRAGLTRPSKAGPVWTGEVRFDAAALTLPLAWRRARRIFVCAHGDLFHERVPDDWIDKVFAVMALAPQHIFQVLTKRAERMRRYLSAMDVAARVALAAPSVPQVGREIMIFDCGWPLPNVWLGVSAEDQPRADERVPHLLATPAAVRFVSAEPLLGPIDLQRICLGESEAEFFEHPEIRRARFTINALKRVESFKWQALDWIIVGGESQAGARPMHPDLARAIRDQCAAAGVPFFFKQWGEWLPDHQSIDAGPYANASAGHRFADGTFAVRAGKARAGRLLDGALHDAMPERR